MKKVICVLLPLVFLPVLVFWPVGDYGFFAIDDSSYVTNNAFVRQGWSWNGLVWAFKSVGHASNWHPLTWISLMTDVQLLGPSPRAHHLVNVFLHVFAGVLLFLFMHQATGALWRSAVVALFFAVHPLHTESVVWIAERKDVLAACFWMLTMMAYLHYLKRKTAFRHILVAFVFMLGLMAKQVLVSLPAILLFLDWWPLGRWGNPKTGHYSTSHQAPRFTLVRLVLEKAPLLILSALASFMAFLAQKKGGLLFQAEEAYPVLRRIANACMAYLAYIIKMLAPSNLAFYYPYPKTIETGRVLLAISVLLLITVAAIWLRRRRPYLVTGWFWYSASLVPMIGIVQIGAQAMADRYTYLPLIGLFVPFVWLAMDYSEKRVLFRRTVAFAAVLCIGLLAVLTRIQVGYWRDSETLFLHTLSITKNNVLIHYNLARFYTDTGRKDDAVVQYRLALDIDPTSPKLRNNLALILADQGRDEEAIREYRLALQEEPQAREVNLNLARILLRNGRIKEAVGYYERAQGTEAGPGQAQVNVAMILLEMGKVREAVSLLREAVRINRFNAEAWNNLGVVLQHQGSMIEAIEAYRRAYELAPSNIEIGLNLSGALLESDGKAEAVHPPFSK